MAWNVYDRHSTYRATCIDIEAAAALMVFYGDESTIRTGRSHLIVWIEGIDGNTHESYDHVAEVVYKRIKEGFYD